MIQANGHNTEQSNHDQSSSERVKCSLLIKYSNRNDDDQKHAAIPYFIPAAKPLGSMIDKDRSYMPECSCCNVKIGLEDTRYNNIITHLKTSDVQKPGLENVNHLIRPNSCFCVGCYQTIKKQTSTNNYTNRACIIMACEQVACHIFNSKLIDILKSTIFINKINFRVQTNEEKKLHKTSFCNAHYDQLLLITQCQLCGNRSLQKFKLHKDIVHEYQLILDEDNIPATIKYGTLICKPCHIYILLRRDKTTIIPSELQKHCDATKTRIINNNKLKTKELESIKLAKYEIIKNLGKKKEDNQLLMVTSLPKNRSNDFTDYSSIPSKSVTKGSALDAFTIPPPLVNSTPVAASMQSLPAVITTTIETALATEEAHLTTITKPILETPINAALTKTIEDMKLTVSTGKPTVLIFKRKRQHTFLDEHSSVPRTKKRFVNRLTTDCIKHTMSEHKPKIPVHKPTIPGIKPTTPENKLTIPIHKPSVQVVKTTTQADKSMTPDDKPMTQIDKPMTQIDKPTIPIHKPLHNKSLVFSRVLRPIFSSKWPVPKKQPFKNLKVPVDKPTISDNKRLCKKSIVFSPVLRPYFNSKRDIPKKHKKTPESISPIRKPTKLQTNQSHHNTLDSQSTSLQTEFPELSLHRDEPSTLSSMTSDMNQVFESIKVPIDKPVNPDKKPMTLVNKSTITNYTPLDNKSPVGPTVLSPFFSSKCTELKKIGNPLEFVSPIIEPTELKENQLHQHTLDSPSISLQTEFPELSFHRDEPSTLSSTTSDVNQLFENLNAPIDKSTITDHKRLDDKSPIFSPVLSTFSSSKCTELKKYEKTPESVSLIKKPTHLETNQSHHNTLDSQSTSPRTEFSDLGHQQAAPSILSSTTTDMNQVFENIKVPIDKPVIPVEKPMIPVNKPTITNYTPLDNKSPVGPTVLSPFFSSKCTELKKNGNPLESVSPIIEPTELKENQLHQHTLDSPSTSLQTEFPELSFHRDEPSTLSSTTSDVNQLFENLNAPIDKSTITDHKRLDDKSQIFSPVLSTFSSSKFTELKKYKKTPESVSLIKKPTHLETNQSHHNTLDSQSTSLQTEFPELSLHRDEPSTLSSMTSDMNQVFESIKVPIDKPVNPDKKPMTLVNKSTITNYTPLDNKSPVGPTVLSPFFSSKCTELKKIGNPLEFVSPIIEPTELQENQLHQHTLDSPSTSLQTEFPELSLHRDEPSTLSSTTSDMNQLFDNLNVSVDKSTITDNKRLDNKSLIFSSVLSTFSSSKCTALKKYEKTPESVSPIKKPSQLQTNQSHQNTLDSQSTSQRTEFPELRRQRDEPSTLSSTTSDMIQLFEKLKSPYPNGMTFINHLLKLETYRNLGLLTVEKNKTTYRQRISNTATTPPHSIHCLPTQEENQTVLRTDDDDNDLTNCDYLSDKSVPSDENSSDSHFIPVKKTSFNIPKQKSNLPKSFGNKPSQYYDNSNSKKQVVDLQENSSITYYPDITIAATTSTITMSITTTEASTNIVSAKSPIFTTINEAIIASGVPATVEMAAVATNTSGLITAVADSTTSITDSTIAINNNEIPVITDTITINYDKSEITSTVNENTTVADAAAVEESTTTLTMITNVASTATNVAVSAAINADSFTAVTTTVTDDTTSVEINTESSTITNTITTESPNSAKCTDAFTIINASPVNSDITTTTETIF